MFDISFSKLQLKNMINYLILNIDFKTHGECRMTTATKALYFFTFSFA